LPALYIPYAVGNGEQAKNIADVVKAGGAITVADRDFSREFVANQVVPIMSSSKKLGAMAVAAKKCGNLDGTRQLLNLIKGVVTA
jgi:UDP-N-acetylglucosamine--N-acetylmuramyl-(pentapeptide) pyrophosphoryl-undecaprenol N-acetylglucosamine transferase